MKKQDTETTATGKGKVDRRNFLAGVAVAGAGAMTARDVAKAAALEDGSLPARKPSAFPPSAMRVQAETSNVVHEPHAEHKGGKPGSDFMMDVIKTLDIEYAITNPASSVRGLHESMITYGGNKMPELLTCMHEESGTAMANGYFKVTGKPMMVLCHGSVGVQHAAMAVYNAWCDRVPIILVVGNHIDAASRSPGTQTNHAMLDPGAFLRDFTKWDDQPGSLQHFAESMIRAYRISMTPPMEPVLISLDGHLQEHPIPGGRQPTIPRFIMPSFPQGDSNALREAAKLLAGAANPVIVVDKLVRSPQGLQNLITLAELLNAPVVDQLGRMNFPNRHYLNSGGNVIGNADVILGLELSDFYGTITSVTDTLEKPFESRIKPDTKLISVGVGDLYIRSNYQDFQRFQSVDIAIAADGETTLPALIEAVRQAIPSSRRSAISARGDAARKSMADGRTRTRTQASYGWDASPISTARLSAEIWNVIKDKDWAMVSRDSNVSNWPHRLWNFDKTYQFIGGPGGQGVGYGLPAAVGGALAHRPHGRFVVNIQTDGDAMYAPGVLWTAAHHRIPLLTVMHNNRAYHQEIMHVHRMAVWRDRNIQGNPVATDITDPNVDYATLAKSMGVAGIGPITSPNDLGPALKRGVEVVEAGEPCVIDVITQPR